MLPLPAPLHTKTTEKKDDNKKRRREGDRNKIKNTNTS